MGPEAMEPPVGTGGVGNSYGGQVMLSSAAGGRVLCVHV